MYSLGVSFMNVLFLTLVSFDSLKERNIYTDLLREFVKNSHNVFVISPVEKRIGVFSHLTEEKNTKILRLRIGNTQKTNIIEKGLSTVMIEPTFKRAIKKYFSDVKFDLVLYSTPPITFVSAIEYVKKRDGAKTYLLLKDIFPQNAVDLGMLSKKGLKGFLYKHFRKQEKKLYSLSDKIGCMSQANVNYVLKHNPEICPENVEICPNSIEVVDKSVEEKTKVEIRAKYGIPIDKSIFVYGGNLGKPQGIPFMIECIRKCNNIESAFFLIVGDGTEAYLVQEYVNAEHPKNMKYLKRLPKEDYDTMVGTCDVGLIFLDDRFTIPNFPSRLLSYMQARLPILACTDPNTDVGKVITEGGFGWWCESNSTEGFTDLIKTILSSQYDFSDIEFKYLCDNYSVDRVLNIIICDKS